MIPIRDITRLEICDLLVHPTRGFAIIDSIDDDAAGTTIVGVEWSGRRGVGTAAFPLQQVCETFLLAVPWGFVFRAFREPQQLRVLLYEQPFEALKLLVDDFDRPVPGDELRFWLVNRGLMSLREFAQWWQLVVPEFLVCDELAWVDGALASVSGPVEMPDSSDAYLAMSPRQRWKIQPFITDEVRIAFLAAAIRNQDVSAVLLLVRGANELPQDLMRQLTELMNLGEPWIGAIMASRQNATFLAEIAHWANISAQRPNLRRLVQILPTSQRDSTVMALLEHAESQSAPEDAQLFLVGLLSPQARQSHPKGRVLFSELPKLPSGQLFSRSIHLAEAIANRHEKGQGGGVRDACISGGALTLGANEPTIPGDDVHTAMELVLRRSIGRLPDLPEINTEVLLAHLAQLAPQIPLDWVAVATRSLSPLPTARQKDGRVLLRELNSAQTSAHKREKLSPNEAPAMRLQVAAETHVGLVKGRNNQANQDAYYLDARSNQQFIGVADGISVATAGSGDLASRILMGVTQRLWTEHSDSLDDANDEQVRAFLQRLLIAGNDAVCHATRNLVGAALPHHIPMGTTVVFALCRGSRVHLCSMGDSRAYLLTEGGAALLTPDQNLRGEWLKNWQDNDPSDLLHQGHSLISYLGHFDEHGQSELLEPFFCTFNILPNETLVMCTDGLTDYGTPTMAEMACALEHAAQSTDLKIGCQQLIQLANAGGGGDNITVAMARWDEVQAK